MRCLDAVELAKLRNLRFDLRRLVVDGHLGGRHRSRRRGFAQEFAEHRLYVPGDEPRRLDWKVYARKERYFVREYQEEKSLRAQLLLDASGSMAYADGGRAPKWELARRLALALAYLVLAGGDSAGLALFDGDERAAFPPRRGLPQLDAMDRALAEASPSGETDPAVVLRRAAVRLPRRSLVLVVSDLLGEATEFLSLVRALRARRHEVFVLQVLDPSERDLPWDGPTLFEPLEGGESLRCEVGLLRASYRRLFDERQRLYEAGFHSAGARYGVFYTDGDWTAGLTRLLA
ncbi:MAG: DUF58 domain-containing protein [Elusimicrobiota bacterium]|jgi:uncharacterized protein (DUF58 family)